MTTQATVTFSMDEALDEQDDADAISAAVAAALAAYNVANVVVTLNRPAEEARATAT